MNEALTKQIQIFPRMAYASDPNNPTGFTTVVRWYWAFNDTESSSFASPADAWNDLKSRLQTAVIDLVNDG